MSELRHFFTTGYTLREYVAIGCWLLIRQSG